MPEIRKGDSVWCCDCSVSVESSRVIPCRVLSDELDSFGQISLEYSSDSYTLRIRRPVEAVFNSRTDALEAQRDCVRKEITRLQVIDSQLFNEIKKEKKEKDGGKF